MAEAVALVKDRVGRVSSFNLIVVIERLPKTRSGKVLRGTMAKIADGENWNMPATIDDPAILDEIKTALQSIGYAGRKSWSFAPDLYEKTCCGDENGDENELCSKNRCVTR